MSILSLCLSLCVDVYVHVASRCACVHACANIVCLGLGLNLLGVIVSTCKLSAERIDKRSKLVKLSF